MAANTSAFSPTFKSYLAGTAAAIACMPSAIGVGIMLRPQLGLDVFGFPAPTAPDATKLVDGLFQLFGVRDVAVGFVTLAIWYNGCRHGKTSGHATLGATMLVGSLVPIVDGWVSRQVIQSGEWKHWIFVPLQWGIGAVLTGLI